LDSTGKFITSLLCFTYQCIISRKAQFIQQTSKILIEKYEGDVPPTLEEVLELPGVGPKMAHILMNVAWDK